MTKYDRLLYILNLLRSRRSLNASALARECSVTERTIYRDMISLSVAEVPIYYDRGYKLASDSFLPPLNFTFDEYQAIKLALESTPLRKIARFGEAVRRVRAKIEAGLNDSVKDKRRTSVDAMAVDIASTEDPRAGEKFFGDIERACTEYKSLEIEYDSVSSGLGVRLVDPYFLVFRASAFYFVAWCHHRKDFRTFRVDRIREVRVSDQRFTRRKGVSVKSYFEGSWQLYTGEPVEVKVRFTGQAARVVTLGKHHPTEWIERQKDGSVHYTATVRGVEEFWRWIIAFGDQAEVLSPVELRQSMIRLGQYLAKTYSR
jgi:predicted DNA-binding transcriptional regulator YafY